MLPRYKDITDLLKKGSTMEAQEQIMALREGALELQEENIELKQKIKEIELGYKFNEDWDKEKERYSLVSPWEPPAQVYALKKSNNVDNQPAHYLCTNCFQQKKKIIVNPINKDGWIYMDCPSCPAILRTGYRGIGNAVYAEEHEQG